MIKKIGFLLFLQLIFVYSVRAQDSKAKYLEAGIEVQQYPTGFLLGIRSAVSVTTHQALELRIGYNLLDHQDFGVQEDEKGAGLGFTLGYRYFFREDHRKWFLGVRADLWFNEVDWKNNIGLVDEMSGTTNVTVLQPTLITGYYWRVNDHFAICPTLAAGAEINIITDGAEVGEGAILLWGLNITYRL